MAGPLTGFSVIEVAGMGPGPFCAVMLADMGAEVLRIQRASVDASPASPSPVYGRGMQSVALDLKSEAGRQALLRLVAASDALIEGYRPGVMERLGLGPDTCLARNPRLIYGRMTGWGQEGPLANVAGHDINYIALTGALAAIGSADSGPIPPLNLVGDFGGGGMMLAFGIVCGLLEASRSGRGQVIDAAMTDGSAMLMASTYGQYGMDRWSAQRASNLLDGSAHFYCTYPCADGKWIAVGAIEPQFYASLLERLGVDPLEFQPQYDQSRWQDWKQQLAAIFTNKTRDQWCEHMEGADACFTPVLDMSEAPDHPHNRARGSFIEVRGVCQPAPAPRFSRTHPEVRQRTSQTPEAILREYAFTDAEIAALGLESTAKEPT